MTRAEKVLSAIIGQPTMVFPSGISAFWACLLLVRPDVVAISDGYPGCHAGLGVYKQLRGEDQVVSRRALVKAWTLWLSARPYQLQKIIRLEDEFPTSGKLLAWIETPLNPTGEARSIEAISKRAHAVNGVVGIDSTFGPPPIQDPFKWGADYVMRT